MLISEGGDNPDTQSHDAQIAGGDGYVFLIGSTHGGPCIGWLIDGPDVLGPNTTRITVLLAHRYSRVQINGDEFDQEWCNECLFELNDATDTVGEDNRDLYLAFNRRVISDQLGDGYGVCSVKLSWVCNVANP